MIDVRKSWIEYMKSKGHHEVSNVPLIPENDPSLLFVNSGMFPLVPFLSGQVTPPSQRLFNVQRCARFNGRDDDISEVGDGRHASFFHMIGNWSIGDYFKETQIPQIFEFFVEKLGIDINKLYVTVFEGDQNAPRDDESIELWKQVFKKYGINAELSTTKVEYTKEGEKVIADNNWEPGKNSNERIFIYPFKKNWWMRGEAVGELGGPDSEMFFDTGLTHDIKFGEKCHINCDCGRFLEIGNNVFMQYVKNKHGGWDTLPQKNVDFGGGQERISMAVLNTPDMYMTPDFYPIIERLEELSGKKYKENDSYTEYKRVFQVIADHMRAAVFAISDNAIPSNKEQGYPVRRLIRRAVRFSKFLEIKSDFAVETTKIVINMFQEYYPHLKDKQELIISVIEKEEKQFLNTLDKGLKNLNQLVEQNKKQNLKELLTPEQVFNLYQTHGLPIEVTVEEVQKYIDQDNNISFDKDLLIKKVREHIKQHKQISKAGSDQKFKGGLADAQEETTRLHTAAHLFLEAARRVLGDHVHQKGANITAERLRFDISHPEKITPEQIKQIEDVVNHAIDGAFDRVIIELPTDEAFRIGAEGEFRERYGDKVNVYKFFKSDNSPTEYSVGIKNAAQNDPSILEHFPSEDVYSFEICGGPHVTNTRELEKSGKFKIIKEESASSGVRRVKAVLN